MWLSLPRFPQASFLVYFRSASCTLDTGISQSYCATFDALDHTIQKLLGFEADHGHDHCGVAGLRKLLSGDVVSFIGKLSF
mmetsp:Transcript_2715/g.5750  ORF Transcript_2715/g.5750 Transcript_2715/m.5750 type:complete len:81 (-) Transcript_2715:49-291(-)